MANVGTWVGFVQPGSLSLVHVGSARAARTRVTVWAIVLLAAVVVVPMWTRLAMWWAMVCVCEGRVAVYRGDVPAMDDGSGMRGGDMCLWVWLSRRVGIYGRGINRVGRACMCRRATSGWRSRRVTVTVSAQKKNDWGKIRTARAEGIRKSGGPREVRWRKRSVGDGRRQSRRGGRGGL
jgi:hypothetical protein